jgi:hypothetical protein
VVNNAKIFHSNDFFFAGAQARRARCSRQWDEQKSRPPATSALLSVTNIPQVWQRTIGAARRTRPARPDRVDAGAISQRMNRHAR